MLWINKDIIYNEKATIEEDISNWSESSKIFIGSIESIPQKKSDYLEDYIKFYKIEVYNEMDTPKKAQVNHITHSFINLQQGDCIDQNGNVVSNGQFDGFGNKCENGNLASIIHYNNGEKYGKYNTWYENGNKRVEAKAWPSLALGIEIYKAEEGYPKFTKRRGVDYPADYYRRKSILMLHTKNLMRAITWPVRKLAYLSAITRVASVRFYPTSAGAYKEYDIHGKVIERWFLLPVRIGFRKIDRPREHARVKGDRNW